MPIVNALYPTQMKAVAILANPKRIARVLTTLQHLIRLRQSKIRLTLKELKANFLYSLFYTNLHFSKRHLMRYNSTILKRMTRVVYLHLKSHKMVNLTEVIRKYQVSLMFQDSFRNLHLLQQPKLLIIKAITLWLSTLLAVISSAILLITRRARKE